jgi:hypothetical protein
MQKAPEKIIILACGNSFGISMNMLKSCPSHDMTLAPPHRHPHLVHHIKEPVKKSMKSPIGRDLLLGKHPNTARQGHQRTFFEFLGNALKKLGWFFKPRIGVEEYQDCSDRRFGPEISPDGDCLPLPGIVPDNTVSETIRDFQSGVGAASVADNDFDPVRAAKLGRELFEHPGQQFLFLKRRNDNTEPDVSWCLIYGHA